MMHVCIHVYKMNELKTLKELQGLVDMLFGLELIVVDKLYLARLVKNISLPSG